MSCPSQTLSSILAAYREYEASGHLKAEWLALDGLLRDASSAQETADECVTWLGGDERAKALLADSAGPPEVASSGHDWSANVSALLSAWDAWQSEVKADHDPARRFAEDNAFGRLESAVDALRTGPSEPKELSFGPDGPVTYLVVIARDGVPEVTEFRDEAEALGFFGVAKSQWSESYLSRVIHGPGVATAANATLRPVLKRILLAWQDCDAQELLQFEFGTRELFDAIGAARDALRSGTAQTVREQLRAAVARAMGPDPHSGRDPHHDTLDAITDGVLARVAVNNARPEAYSAEPWREQTADYHSAHACGHTDNAWMAIRYNRRPWLSDLGQPEAAHAGLRLDFLLWRHGRDANGITDIVVVQPKTTPPSEGVTPHGVQWCNRCKDGPCEGILLVHACEIRKQAVSV